MLINLLVESGVLGAGTHQLHPTAHTAVQYSTPKAVRHNRYAVRILSRHVIVVEKFLDDVLNS